MKTATKVAVFIVNDNRVSQLIRIMTKEVNTFIPGDTINFESGSVYYVDSGGIMENQGQNEKG